MSAALEPVTYGSSAVALAQRDGVQRTFSLRLCVVMLPPRLVHLQVMTVTAMMTSWWMTTTKMENQRRKRQALLPRRPAHHQPPKVCAWCRGWQGRTLGMLQSHVQLSAADVLSNVEALAAGQHVWLQLLPRIGHC